MGCRGQLRIDAADRMTERESFDVLEGHAPGGLPIVRFAFSGRAVGPAVFVHRYGIVRFGPLVFRASAEEVDAIVHHKH